MIAQVPEYLAARVALAGQLAKANQPEAALEQLRAAVKAEDSKCIALGTDRRPGAYS